MLDAFWVLRSCLYISWAGSGGLLGTWLLPANDVDAGDECAQ
jgi:hypothetical protein